MDEKKYQIANNPVRKKEQSFSLKQNVTFEI